MPAFTTSEIDLISKQKKDQADLPQYYSAEIAKTAPAEVKEEVAKQTISRDFEAYLILQSTEQKQKTLSWIKTVNTINQDNKDRDDLLERYLSLRDTDASARITEIDETLQEFESFRNGLFAAGDDGTKFAEVVELSLMARALQTPIDEMQIIRENAFHEKNVTALLKVRFDARKNTDDSQKELESWQTVVSEYEGQSGSSGTNNQGSVLGGSLL